MDELNASEKLQREWLGTLAPLIGARRAKVKSRLEKGLVSTGRLADPAAAALNPVAAEAARARREDMVQNLVADRGEISANVAYLEVHAASAQRQFDAAVQTLADATQEQVNAQAAWAPLPNGAAKNLALQRLNKANDALARATAQHTDTGNKTVVARGLRAGAATVAVNAQVATVRAGADLTSAPARADASVALKLANPLLADAALETAIDEALRDGAVQSHYARLGTPVLEHRNPGGAHSAADLAAAGRERLLDIQMEQIVSQAIEDRIAAEVDKNVLTGEDRIVHPMQRTQEVEKIVVQVAAAHGFTNVAHFISRHGAQRDNPDAGQTTLAVKALPDDPLALTINDPARPESTRSAHDAAARVITGVGPDQATYGAARALLPTETQVGVPLAGPGVLPGATESITVPHYANIGEQIGPASSQHASAKAALFALDEGVAQAARAARENPQAAEHTLNVFTGKETVDGDPLGVYPEQGGLGASYAVNQAGFTDLEKLKDPAGVLSQAVIQRRLGALSKTVGATTAKVTLLPDEMHGGYTPMTMFTQSAARPSTVEDSTAPGEAYAAATAAAHGPAEAAALAGIGPVAAATAGGQNNARAAANKAAAAAAQVMQALVLKLAMENEAPDLNMPADARARTRAAALLAITGPLAGSAAAIAAADAAAATAEAQAQALLDARLAHRDKAFRKREEDAAAALPDATARADAGRVTAATSKASAEATTLSTRDALIDAMAHLPVGADAPAAQLRLLKLADDAAAAEAARLQAATTLAELQSKQARADEHATAAAPQAAQAAARTDAACQAAEAAHVAAQAAKEQVQDAITAAGAVVPPRLTEALASAEAAVERSEIDLEHTAFAWGQAEAARGLVTANLAVSSARKQQEAAQALLAAARQQHDGPPQPATPERVEALRKAGEDLLAARGVLTGKRAERDQSRIDLGKYLHPDHPARQDEADDIAAQSAAAATALTQATAAAALNARQMSDETALLIPGGDPAKTALALTRLQQLAGEGATARVDEAAAARAATARQKIEANIAEAQRARKVQARGEDAVLAEELAADRLALDKQPGEALPAYEARMQAQQAQIARQRTTAADELTAQRKDNTDKLDVAKARLTAAADKLILEKKTQTDLAAQLDLLDLQLAETVAKARAEHTAIKLKAGEQRLRADADQARADEAAKTAAASQLRAEQLVAKPSADAQARAGLADEARTRLAGKHKEAEARAASREDLDKRRAAAALDADKAEADLTTAQTTPDEAERGPRERSAQITVRIDALQAGLAEQQQDLEAQRERLALFADSIEQTNTRLDALQSAPVPDPAAIQDSAEVLAGFLAQQDTMQQALAMGAGQLAGLQADLAALAQQKGAADDQAAAARGAAVHAARERLEAQRSQAQAMAKEVTQHEATAATFAQTLKGLDEDSSRLDKDAKALREAELQQAGDAADKDRLAAAGAAQKALESAGLHVQLDGQAGKAGEASAREEGKAPQQALDRKAALDAAAEQVRLAEAGAAAATKARDEAQKVSTRIEAELATREAVGQAHEARANADAAARIARAKADADPALAPAAAKAEHLLSVAAKNVEVAEAAGAMQAADLALKTALIRYTAGKKAYDDAFAKPEPTRSDLEKKLVASWVPVQVRLTRTRDAAQTDYDNAKALHDPLVLEAAALVAATPP